MRFVETFIIEYAKYKYHLHKRYFFVALLLVFMESNFFFRTILGNGMLRIGNKSPQRGRGRGLSERFFLFPLVCFYFMGFLLPFEVAGLGVLLSP